MKPNLQIIGVQKSGTTALAHFLSQHPNICLAKNKEAHVFDDPSYLEHPKPHQYAKDKYDSVFQHYNGEQIICDATPITIFNTHFLEECYHYNPNAKFIVSLRDPVERALSHYHMSFKRGTEKRTALSAFICERYKLPTLSHKDVWSYDSAWREHSYLSRGLYSRQLRELFNIVPRQQVLIIFQHDLKIKHEETLSRIFNFLSVTQVEVNAETVFSPNRPPKSLNERLAELYAKAYFFLKDEKPSTWKKIIEDDS
ncbi:sulfotransferase [Neiella sp. HB171785]|uniref:Sulfotransferase n=1 Tax=Neiella litorisoli TaxID=2771431 RepID=A0A8J6QV10_9GAMM|nr:sulfotransferase [Neiella litorisoli]MBD1389788.1 sulfotransferase [Neiella litorisoli]